MSEKIGILLANDDVQFGEWLSILLKLEPGFEITAEVKNSDELLEQLRQNEPELVVMSFTLPEMEKKALAAMKLYFPSVKAIVLNDRSTHNLVTEYILGGASCYLTSGCEIGVLYEAVIAVHTSGHYVDNNSISKSLLNSLVPDTMISRDVKKKRKE